MSKSPAITVTAITICLLLAWPAVYFAFAG
jgi:hypothetical protein